MTETILAADAEAAAIAELVQRIPELDGGKPARAATSIAKGSPDEYFRVICTGGFERSMLVDVPTLTVESYARGEKRAADRAALARGILTACERGGEMGGVTCYQVDLAARPQNLPNPQVPGWYRYTFTISADLRMAAV
jgi:hypothetical protein